MVRNNELVKRTIVTIFSRLPKTDQDQLFRQLNLKLNSKENALTEGKVTMNDAL